MSPDNAQAGDPGTSSIPISTEEVLRVFGAKDMSAVEQASADMRRQFEAGLVYDVPPLRVAQAGKEPKE